MLTKTVQKLLGAYCKIIVTHCEIRFIEISVARSATTFVRLKTDLVHILYQLLFTSFAKDVQCTYSYIYCTYVNILICDIYCDIEKRTGIANFSKTSDLLRK